MIRLIVTEDDESRVVESDESPLTIGRGSENVLRICDEGGSREHCRIQRTAEGSFALIDLASRNGTHLNGKRIDEHPLAVGDTITIGTTTITVEHLPEPSHAPPPALDESDTDVATPEAIELVFLSGSNKGQRHLIRQRITSIGRRRRDNDIALFDTGISNRHAELRHTPDGFVLVDVGSRNGTLLNDQRVARHPVRLGDRIQIGKTVIELREPGAPAQAPCEPAPAPVPTPSPSPLPSVAAEPEPPATEDDTAEAQAGSPRNRIIPLTVAIAVVVALFATVVVVRALHKGSHQRGSLPGTSLAAAPSTSGPARPASGTPAAPVRKGTASAAARQAQQAMAAADALAKQGRYAEAIRRFRDLAHLHAGRQAIVLRARQRAEDVEREAAAALDAALRLLRRARLTARSADFEAARGTLEPLQKSLEGTAFATKAADALAEAATGRKTSAEHQRDAQAALLLEAARRHSARKEPSIARLHCTELLTRFPDSPASADAKALLDSLAVSSPEPPAKK